MSPDNKTRNETEAYLKGVESTPGFLVVVLNLINRLSTSTAPQECAVRQAASVIFKNTIKRCWAPEDETQTAISESDRDTLKLHLVDLMCASPPDVQKQMAEAGRRTTHIYQLLTYVVILMYIVIIIITVVLFLFVGRYVKKVSIISKHDFPAKWPSLIPHLSSKLSTPDLLVIKGVMITANSIFKRFR